MILVRAEARKAAGTMSMEEVQWLYASFEEINNILMTLGQGRQILQSLPLHQTLQSSLLHRILQHSLTIVHGPVHLQHNGYDCGPGPWLLHTLPESLM